MRDPPTSIHKVENNQGRPISIWAPHIHIHLHTHIYLHTHTHTCKCMHTHAILLHKCKRIHTCIHATHVINKQYSLAFINTYLAVLLICTVILQLYRQRAWVSQGLNSPNTHRFHTCPIGTALGTEELNLFLMSKE